MKRNFIDRTIGFFSPRAELGRMRARVATEMLARHYEAASVGRRTMGWNRSSQDVNAVIGGALERLRASARDLVRNNGNAEAAIDAICNQTVGWGIVAKPETKDKKLIDLWKRWAETTDCDADGRNDLYGLQHLALRTVVESGEVLIRRRLRMPDEGLSLPMQLQVLEPDFLDTNKTGIILRGTDRDGNSFERGRIIRGIEFDLLGRRVAYWMFREHPGAEIFGAGVLGSQSYRVPAENVLHVYRHMRPGQVRGATWFAPILLRFKDHDEFEDATLMKQKIAACLAVLTSDTDGTAPPLGAEDPSDPRIDSLEPGLIMNVPPGRDVTVVNPPSSGDYGDYTAASLRTISAGIGIAYEDLTGDYSGLNFSSARMSRLAHWPKVEKWRWQMLIPQMCAPIWEWAMEMALITGVQSAGKLDPATDQIVYTRARWSAPPAPMIDPSNEGLAYQRNIRNGFQTLPEVIRERGYEPDEVLDEIAETNKKLDEKEIVLDCDPRTRTSAGNAITAAAPAPADPNAGTSAEEVPPPPTKKADKKKPNGKAAQA